MKQALTAGILWVLLLFGGAWILAPRPGAAEPEKTDTPIRQTEQADSMDSRSVLQVYDGEKTVSMTMAEYLPGVVRGEMPASFEPEALKAQAVAERTFIYYHMLGGRKAAHPDADVCMDYRCCNAWVSREQAKSNWGDNYEEYDRKIQQSVEETDGQVMLYEGKPILAAFHSSSAGVTAKSSDAWVSDRPYLVSVESPENADSVPNYYSVNTFTPEEFREKILAAEPTAVLEGLSGGLGHGPADQQLQPGGIRHRRRRVLPGYGGAQHPGPALGLLHGGVRGRWHYLPCDRLWPRSRHEPVRGQCPGPGGQDLAGDSAVVLPGRIY